MLFESIKKAQAEKKRTSVRELLFKPSKKAQAEKRRATRQESNLSRGLLRLPAELRNQIYKEVIPTDQEIVKRKIHVSMFLAISMRDGHALCYIFTNGKLDVDFHKYILTDVLAFA